MFASFENLNPRWLLDGDWNMEGDEQSMPAESLLMNKKETTIELLTSHLKEKELQITELLKEIGRLEERLSKGKE
ncbi:MAG: hypothetical protein IPH20_18510 [Bacteroidales bacterium]|nr:hypothetical protein [Bacteroidales bacterium]